MGASPPAGTFPTAQLSQAILPSNCVLEGKGDWTWGDPDYGADSSQFQNQSSGHHVKHICSKTGTTAAVLEVKEVLQHEAADKHGKDEPSSNELAGLKLQVCSACWAHEQATEQATSSMIA